MAQSNATYGTPSKSDAPSPHVTMAGMISLNAIKTNEYNPPVENDWIAEAMRAGRLIEPKVVAEKIGFQNRASFWEWVRRENVPCVRLSSRKFGFPPARLQAWLDSRTTGK